MLLAKCCQDQWLLIQIFCLGVHGARKRLNRGLRTYLLQNNSCAIAHPDFDDSYSALYDDDGVHLSFIGKDIFINTIQEALFQFLRYPKCNVYPMEHMSVDWLCTYW